MITLVDTVGLGNNALGTDGDILEFISGQSDAVVFLHHPYTVMGGGADSEIANAYAMINDSCRNKDLS